MEKPKGKAQNESQSELILKQQVLIDALERENKVLTELCQTQEEIIQILKEHIDQLNERT